MHAESPTLSAQKPTKKFSISLEEIKNEIEDLNLNET